MIRFLNKCFLKVFRLWRTLVQHLCWLAVSKSIQIVVFSSSGHQNDVWQVWFDKRCFNTTWFQSIPWRYQVPALDPSVDAFYASSSLETFLSTNEPVESPVVWIVFGVFPYFRQILPCSHRKCSVVGSFKPVAYCFLCFQHIWRTVKFWA